MKLAWINGTEIRKGIRFVKTLFGENNVESTQSSNPFGFESNPSKNFIAIIADTTNNGQPVIIGYLKKAALESLNVGDSMQYSTDAEGVVKSTITLRADGTVEVLGTSDFMVRYSALETAYDQLKEDHNSLVTAFNTHVHPTAAVGSPSPPTPVPNSIPTEPSTGDITGAKIEEVKTI